MSLPRSRRRTWLPCGKAYVEAGYLEGEDWPEYKFCPSCRARLPSEDH